MSWFAVSPLTGTTPARRFVDAGVMHQGTVLVELEGRLADGRLRLFSTAAQDPMPGDLTLWRDPGGVITAEVTTASAPARASVELGHLELCPTLRIFVTWGPGQAARIWISAPEVHPTPRIADLAVPPAPTRAAMIAAVDTLASRATSDLVFAAAGDALEPVGPMPGLDGATRLMTPSGPARIDSLSAGDAVIALDRAGRRHPVPVLSALIRTLPARGSFRPVELFAPYFGLTSDLVVSANEHITLSGPNVEYLFAREKVLVPARYLVSGRTGRFLPATKVATWHQVLLPAQEQLPVHNVTVESLHIGGLRRNAEAHAASLVANVPRRALPHHPAPTYPVLSDFEAVTLLDQLGR